MQVFDRIYASLSRVTDGSKRLIPEIDGLRFVAIFPVVVLHVQTNFLRTTSLEFARDPESYFFHGTVYGGSIGVPLFFIISGFLLSLPFVNWRLHDGRPVGASSATSGGG